MKVFNYAFVIKIDDFSTMRAPTQNSPPKALPNLDFGRCFKTNGFMYAFVIQFDDFGKNVRPCRKQPLPGTPNLDIGRRNVSPCQKQPPRHKKSMILAKM